MKKQARLPAHRDEFEADELMVITVTGDYRTRLDSYRLLPGFLKYVSRHDGSAVI